jgi:aerobic carbon-monoxide dehydrogenase medium subunit
MRSFDLVEPKSLKEACAALADDADAKVIAGGTALLTIIKQGLLRPQVLVNLKKIHDGSAISFDPHIGLRIGALATLNEVETSTRLRENYPALAEACHAAANIRVRNMATIGGNLAHADYQSDPPTVLAALDARVELTSAGGSRELSLADFLLGSYETALAPGELISAILIPPARDMRSIYLKFTTGSSEERPLRLRSRLGANGRRHLPRASPCRRRRFGAAHARARRRRAGAKPTAHARIDPKQF